jgi:sterol desaturase/sphingolipid hydroxylase (fatty acid hydroxylase superfamily)
MFDQLDERQETQPTEDSARCLCYDHERSTLDRPALWIPIVIVMFASVVFLFAIANLTYGIQLGSLIPYTAFVALGTFSAQRGMQPYFFECLIVQQTMPRLLRRHCDFLIAIVLLETIALSLTRYMPLSWLNNTGKNGSPFTISLIVICLCLASVQVFTNRTLHERAHEKSQCSPDPANTGS